MSPLLLLMLAIGAIGALLVLILRCRLHPFLALLGTACALALAAGMDAGAMAAAVEEGMGKTLGHVAAIIALGAMIGRMVELSGGAGVLADRLVTAFGARRAPLALTVAAFAIGIPVFFEVGVIMLMPLAAGAARSAGRPLRTVALPMCLALLVVHALLPPHPGMVAVAGLLAVPVGRLLVWGLPVAACTAAFGYALAAVLVRRADPVEATDAAEEAPIPTDERDPEVAPVGAGSVIALIAFPIALILLGTVGDALLPAGHPLASVLAVTGTPFVALLLGVLLCGYVLGVRRGWSLDKVAAVLGSALPGIALVVLVTGAGGALARVLVASGAGGAIADGLRASGLPVLALAYLLTMLLRAAQGPTTVALIATAGIVAPAIAGGGYSPDQLALICLAMGAGGLSASHVNDAGFWIVTRLIGLSVAAGLRSWTVLTTACGLFAFTLIAAAWQFV